MMAKATTTSRTRWKSSLSVPTVKEPESRGCGRRTVEPANWMAKTAWKMRAAASVAMIHANREPDSRTGSMIMRSCTTPISTASSRAIAMAARTGSRCREASWKSTAAPRMKNSPCAKFSTLVGA